MLGRLVAAAGFAVLCSASPALAAADLTIGATHAPARFLRVEGTNTTVNPGTLTVVVRNVGDVASPGPATVSLPLPTGLTALVNDFNAGAGPVAASGAGWTCTATSCTRSDALAAGEAYPPIKVTVRTANTAPESVTFSPSVGSAVASDVVP